ncbi:MAG: hypothetical protein K2K97_08170 [Muribaculaceae bacterium]|nr:hypothetical protein [Muribaculaceae bacterium]
MKKEEAWGLYPLLVPLYKALALPINVERATQSLTQYMIYQWHYHHDNTTGVYHTRKASIVASFLTLIWKLLSSV